MNKRILKKSINNLSHELLAECLWVLHCNKFTNIDDVENVVDSILITQADFLARISHPDAKNAKFYFRKLRDDFLIRVEDLIEQIRALA